LPASLDLQYRAQRLRPQYFRLPSRSGIHIQMLGEGRCI
jgi:hypothetical protein